MGNIKKGHRACTTPTSSVKKSQQGKAQPQVHTLQHIHACTCMLALVHILSITCTTRTHCLCSWPPSSYNLVHGCKHSCKLLRQQPACAAPPAPATNDHAQCIVSVQCVCGPQQGPWEQHDDRDCNSCKCVEHPANMASPSGSWLQTHFFTFHAARSAQQHHCGSDSQPWLHNAEHSTSSTTL